MVEAEAELENGIRNAHRVRVETKTADKLWEGSEERKEDPSSQEGRHIQSYLMLLQMHREKGLSKDTLSSLVIAFLPKTKSQ